MIRKGQYRSFLIITKYLMFIVSVVYFITSLLACVDADVKYLLLIIKIPAWIVAYGVLLSKVLNFCVLHRIPMYYMLLCNIIFILRSHLGGIDTIYLCIHIVLFMAYLLTIFVLKSKCTNNISLSSVKRKLYCND